MHPSLIASIFLLSAMAQAIAQTEEQRSTLADQKEVAVTIYNENLALIKDQRKLQLQRGASALAFRDVSARMRPETALLRSVSAPGSLSVLEQNFDFDLLTPQKLLEKYVNRTVSIIRTNAATGTETTEQAQVLSARPAPKRPPQLRATAPGASAPRAPVVVQATSARLWLSKAASQKTRTTKPITKPSSWAKRPMPVTPLVPEAGSALRELRVSSE